MNAFDRSLQQRRDALLHANEIRTHRAKLKIEIAAGRTSASALIDHPYPDVLTMKVWDVLLAMPKVGRIKANKMLQRARVSPSKTLGGLSDRQRREINHLLPVCYQAQQEQLAA